VQLVWFKRDLRVNDHEPLYRAAQAGPVLPVYIVEPGLWQQPDMSSRHWAFIRESLVELRQALQKQGQALLVRQGEAAAVLEELCRERGVTAVWSHQETGNAWTYRRDIAVAERLAKLGISWKQPRQHAVERGTCDRDRWTSQWEALMRHPLYPAPRLEPLPNIDTGQIPERPGGLVTEAACPGRQQGGRLAAQQALASFLYDRGERYHREMSSPRSAASSCSRISAHLAWGTLSMREAVQATRARRLEIKQSGRRGTWGRALSAFESRLHWHCHFMQKLESEPRIEFENMQRATQSSRDDQCDPARLEAWRTGRTGWPLVDACMRALIHTGWINFRMRAMLMSVASYQLWLHWREPSLHLARLFVDYEPGIHYPQVQMQSGTTGINTLRIYNPVKQSLDQDPEGIFIRTWVPELTRVSNSWIHTPWKMPKAAQIDCETHIGIDYPKPLVDHEEAARAARQALIGARRAPGARDESRQIMQRHGSRKRTRKRRMHNPLQGELFGDGT